MSVPPLSDKVPSRTRVVIDNRDHTKPILCDCCGKSCRPNWLTDQDCQDMDCDPQECVVLKGHWGFFSKKDLEYHECVLCEPCYDEMVVFIKSRGGKVRRYEYDPWDGEPVRELPDKPVSPT